MPPTEHKRISFLLMLGITLMPYVFAWVLLRPGYSRYARLIGFAWMAGIVLGAITVPFALQSTPASTIPQTVIDPNRKDKDAAIFLAKMIVPKAMKDPSSAQFGRVWGVAKNTACGYVNGKNSFGAMAGEQRFIFALGAVEFDNHTSRFAHHWNTFCFDKLLSDPPIGAEGKRWGSAPTSDLQQLADPSEDGLVVFGPKAAPRPLEGVPVKEQDFQYDHRRLYQVDYFISGEANREAIKAALVKKYGTPLEYDDAAEVYKWEWPAKRIVIEVSWKDASKQTTVTFAHGPHIDLRYL